MPGNDSTIKMQNQTTFIPLKIHIIKCQQLGIGYSLYRDFLKMSKQQFSITGW